MYNNSMYVCVMNKELLKGTLTSIIMKLLADNGKMYGYEIAQCVKEMTAGKISIKEGSLYPALHKLLAEEMVVVEELEVGNRIRRYYKLTPKGKKQVAVQLSELVDFLQTIYSLVAGTGNALAYAK
jgi:PadR family transcriptional regulator, regulatory protein PadR